jgi:hypothetical protein
MPDSMTTTTLHHDLFMLSGQVKGSGSHCADGMQLGTRLVCHLAPFLEQPSSSSLANSFH